MVIKRTPTSISVDARSRSGGGDRSPSEMMVYCFFIDDHVTLMVQNRLVPTRDQIHTQQGWLTWQ
jgi:hypothetical protein